MFCLCYVFKKPNTYRNFFDECSGVLYFHMKINQLFTKKIDNEMLIKLLNCFGLNDLHDKKYFCKSDMQQHQSLQRIIDLISELEPYYLPCKAKIYLDVSTFNEKRAVTILKQVLRLYDHYLQSKERNVNGRKVIYYQIVDLREKLPHHMHRTDVANVIQFD